MKPPFLKNEPGDNIFTKILREGAVKGILNQATSEARKWYMDRAKGVPMVDENKLMSSDPTRFRQIIVPGRMYLFAYDPKHKKTLPYYDTLPLIFPISMGNSYFLGLNLHYLPLNYRAKLMDALYSLLNNKKFDESTKVQLSYKILKSVQELRYYKPCIKKYLKIHVRSRFVSIGANEWSIAMALPLARFEKQPVTRVYSDSVNMINYGKPSTLPNIKPRKPM